MPNVVSLSGIVAKINTKEGYLQSVKVEVCYLHFSLMFIHYTVNVLVLMLYILNVFYHTYPTIMLYRYHT